MGLINQFFKIVRLSKPTWDTKKIWYMVSKWPIVRMLHDSHYLNHIISSFFYPRKNMIFEMSKRMNFCIYPTHSYMTLINFNVLVLPIWLLILKFVFFKLNVNSIITIILILMSVIYPSRDPIFILSRFKLNLAFNFWKLLNRFLSLKLTFPMPPFILLSIKNILLCSGVLLYSNY